MNGLRSVEPPSAGAPIPHHEKSKPETDTPGEVDGRGPSELVADQRLDTGYRV